MPSKEVKAVNNESGDAVCVMDDVQSDWLEESDHFQSDTRRKLCFSGACIGPVGLHRLEQPRDVHLRLA
jgi:hypothetical protein